MIDIKDIECKDCIVQPICRQKGVEVKLILIYSQLKELIFRIDASQAYPFANPMTDFRKLLNELIKR